MTSSSFLGNLSLFLLVLTFQAQPAFASESSESLRLALQNGPASQCQGLWAKETIQVGSVCVEPDRRNPDQLIVSFSTADTGWKLDAAQLWLGQNITDNLPVEVFELDNKGDATKTTSLTKASTPDLSKFPYVKNDLDGQHQHFGFVVKLFYLNYVCPDSRGTTFSAVAHATVSAPRSGLRNGDGSNTKASAWASPTPLVPPTRTQSTTSESPIAEQHISFDFTLVCDRIAARPEHAPERHHANYVPS